MASVNFYLDKTDKKGFSPIHLRFNCENKQIKISTCEKVKVEDFDKEQQRVKFTAENHLQINHYLDYLVSRTDELINKTSKKAYTIKEIKSILTSYVDSYKDENKLSIVNEQLELYGQSVTFIDLFAGAGGFSEGFLQAEKDNKFFDFLLANDINENCELTHVVRYNHQLGLDAQFICQDITEPNFLPNLLEKIGSRKVDVVCGGPPCQSFSLAGKRKKFDKKDDLFAHYLGVIKALQPKYFVMENVKGILTKEGGKIKELILKEINSIVDKNELPKVVTFTKKLQSGNSTNEFILSCLLKKIEIEQAEGATESEALEAYIKNVEVKFRQLTPKIVDYQTSKTDERISTIRHGFNILIRSQEWAKIKREIIREKDFCNIDNDYFADDFTSFISSLEPEEVITKIEKAFNVLPVAKNFQAECNEIIEALKIYTLNFDDTLSYIETLCNQKQLTDLKTIIKEIRLYRIEAPFVANASNYGVPQNRERVLFIGCRKDQLFISEIPPTVNENNKVSIFEALYDLDFVGNNEEAHHYESVDIHKQFNGTAKKLEGLLKARAADGKLNEEEGKTFAQWSRSGRLISRYNHASKPFYVKNKLSLEEGEKVFDTLHNHKTSNQNEDVVKRLDIIRKEGDYKAAQTELESCGLTSKKRNYNVLNPESQSPTIMTIPDDYIHYNSPRALTVREMARLQSFDDSFVFQGKRSTGGNNRKTEVPQCTLVGNAVPPLLARAVANEILKYIK